MNVSRRFQLSLPKSHFVTIKTERDKNLYKSCILFTEFNCPPNLVRDKGIYSTRAGPILTSAGPAWDLRVQLVEDEGEDQ
jgi:hypothetical protein